MRDTLLLAELHGQLATSITSAVKSTILDITDPDCANLFLDHGSKVPFNINTHKYNCAQEIYIAIIVSYLHVFTE